MARKKDILTRDQNRFLEIAGRSNYIVKDFYFTGGTPLAAFYLRHRPSEDIDLFTEKEEVNIFSVRNFIRLTQKELGVSKVDYRQFLGLHSFQLYFSKKNILKVDFNYYPFPQIEKGIKYKNLSVDSLLDIAVNKVHTIAMRPRARDFIDIYFIVKEGKHNFRELLAKAKIKFDWHIDALQLGSRLLMAREVKDYPKMIKKISPKEWQTFFIEEARKLKPHILK